MTIGAFLALLSVAAIAYLWRRDQQNLRIARAGFFDECLDVFQSYRITQDAPAYPVLEGVFRGARVRLAPVVDHLTWRKLPCLWLQVTAFRDNPFPAVLALAMRPRGDDSIWPASDLPYPLALPPGCPPDAACRTDDPGGVPPAALIEPLVPLFADGRMKALVTSARGVRLVMLIAEARRANYAVVRQIDLSEARLARGDTLRLLHAALGLADSLATAPAPSCVEAA